MFALTLGTSSVYRQYKINDVARKGVALFFLLHLCFTTVKGISSVLNKPTVVRPIAEETQTTLNVSKYVTKAVNLPKPRDEVEFSAVVLTGERPSFINVIRNHNGQKNNRISRKHRRSRPKKAKDRKNRRRRHKRVSRRHGSLEQKSCPTRTNYVFKETAVDIFGDKVDVYPVISIGNLAMDQYFYETYCYTERCICGGIDNKKFKSSCQTTYSYSYAKVVKRGEIGWSYIKVRSGCSCVIQEKIARSASLEDLIAHSRT